MSLCDIPPPSDELVEKYEGMMSVFFKRLINAASKLHAAAAPYLEEAIDRENSQKAIAFMEELLTKPEIKAIAKVAMWVKTPYCFTVSFRKSYSHLLMLRHVSTSTANLLWNMTNLYLYFTIFTENIKKKKLKKLRKPQEASENEKSGDPFSKSDLNCYICCVYDFRTGEKHFCWHNLSEFLNFFSSVKVLRGTKFFLCVFVVVILISATRGWSAPLPYALNRTESIHVFFQVSFKWNWLDLTWYKLRNKSFFSEIFKYYKYAYIKTKKTYLASSW